MRPPRVLALDVSGPGGGAALLSDGAITQRLLPPDVPRGRQLLPAIRELLQASCLAPRELDAVACGVGPGSFTGIRIGVAAAATFAYAAGLPAFAVDSLRGLAENAPRDAGDVLVALDARRGAVFAARFRREAGVLRPVGPTVHAGAEDVARVDERTFVLGDARERYPEHFARFPGTADAPPRPDAIARLAAERFAAGERPDPRDLRPAYFRPSDPEL